MKTDPVYREKIIVQVKGGAVNRSDVATLLGDVENQKAAGGVLITLEKPSKQMRTEAADAGLTHPSSGTTKIIHASKFSPSKVCSTAPNASTPRRRSIHSQWPRANPSARNRQRCYEPAAFFLSRNFK